MMKAGCPIERHELTNDEWLLLGVVKTEQEIIAQEEAKKKHGRND